MDLLAKRLIMTVMSLVLLGFTFESVRRRKLRERYAVLWMLCGAMVLVCAAFPSIPDFVARRLGLTFIEAAAYIFAFFLILVIFHISIAISRSRENQEASARRMALLQAEIEKLRTEVDSLRKQHSPEGK